MRQAGRGPNLHRVDPGDGRLEREGALDRGKRRPKRKSQEGLEKVAGARAGRIFPS